MEVRRTEHRVGQVLPAVTVFNHPAIGIDLIHNARGYHIPLSGTLSAQPALGLTIRMEKKKRTERTLPRVWTNRPPSPLCAAPVHLSSVLCATHASRLRECLHTA